MDEETVEDLTTDEIAVRMTAFSFALEMAKMRQEAESTDTARIIEEAGAIADFLLKNEIPL